MLALTAVAQAAPAYAQARTTIVTPRILTPDTPRFQHLGNDPALCIKVKKKKTAKRTQVAWEEREFCRTE
jgi:hypothetical protein